MNKKKFQQGNDLKLEDYRVKRAVLMAAGIGKRMRPVTYTVPKPMVKVNGIRIIDTIIDALMQNEINDIYIIRGYKLEKFDELLEKYPNLHFINNLMYDKGNNIISACTAGNLISNAYVMPADIYISDASVFPKYQFHSNVLGYKVGETKDWCIETEEKRIIRLSPGGSGDNCYKDTGIFYWNKEDGNRMSRHIAEVCRTKEGRERYWSNVPFELYKDQYHVQVRECKPTDVIEIDTLEELCVLDNSYR